MVAGIEARFRLAKRIMEYTKQSKPSPAAKRVAEYAKKVFFPMFEVCNEFGGDISDGMCYLPDGTVIREKYLFKVETIFNRKYEGKVIEIRKEDYLTRHPSDVEAEIIHTKTDGVCYVDEFNPGEVDLICRLYIPFEEVTEEKIREGVQKVRSSFDLANKILEESEELLRKHFNVPE